MSVVTPDRLWLLPQARRDAVCDWLRAHGLDPGRTAAFEVDGAHLHVDCYEVDGDGKFVVRDGELVHEYLAVDVRTPPPLLPL